MIQPKNSLILIALMFGLTFMYTGCASTEEVVEEEPQVVRVAEEPAPEPAPPPPPAPEPVAIPELDNIYFGFDLSNIDPDAARLLDNHINKMRELPAAYKVSVDAYTDHIGGDQYNLRLSYRRANSVVQYLSERGISTDRIESRGLGKAPQPCYTQFANDPGCPDNRRAEFRVIEHLYAPRQN